MKTVKYNDGVFEGEREVSTTRDEVMAEMLSGVAQLKAAHTTWLDEVREETECLLIEAMERNSIKADVDVLNQLRCDIQNFAHAAHPEYAAFMIGQRYREAQIRIWSYRLQTGRKQRQAAIDGHAAVHGTAEEKQSRWAAYKATYIQIRERNPHMLHEDLCRQTAARHGVSVKTIKRHDPRK